jgi:hypothetical protein
MTPRLPRPARTVPPHRSPWARTAHALVAALLLLGSTACDRSATEPSVEGLEVNEIILEDGAGNFIFSHYDHWHGSPTPRMGEPVSYTVWFSSEQLSPDDHNIVPREKWFSLDGRSEYDLRVVIADPTIATWSGDRAAGVLRGLRDASTQLSMVVRRGATTVYEAPPLTFRVRP